MNKKTILTFTTDLGTKDYYNAILKGKALQLDREISIIDITHQLTQYNLIEAAFIFKNAYPHFPADTVHFVTMNSDRTDCKQFLTFKHRDQYFIGPDNGIFSLVFDEKPDLIHRIPYDRQDKFPLKKIIESGLSAIMSGDLTKLGEPVTEYEKKIAIHPATSNSLIRGTVIHIDHFGNIIVNIHRELFEHIRQERKFEIYYKRWDPITEISYQYQDVAQGEILARFNSSDYLEISINMGKAADTLGLGIDDNIQIDFL